MEKQIGIYLKKDGFYAGRKLANGTLALGVHKITEDEIISMFSVILRTFQAKTGKDTLVVQGTDGKAMIAKLVKIETQAPADGAAPAEEQPKGEQAAAGAPPKRKRTRKAKGE